jgi:hypothetical protein
VPIRVAGTIAGLDALSLRVDAATLQSTADALHLFQAAGMLRAPVGTPGNTTNAPGDLARSIDVEGPEGGEGVYEGRVGPTVIYGRQRELGGAIDKLDGYMKFSTTGAFLPNFGQHYPEQRYGGGDFVFTHHVFQFGAHYMLQAQDEVLLSGSIEAVTEAHVDAAIAGTQ